LVGWPSGGRLLEGRQTTKKVGSKVKGADRIVIPDLAGREARPTILSSFLFDQTGRFSGQRRR
jgi:hypothetical protein